MLLGFGSFPLILRTFPDTHICRVVDRRVEVGVVADGGGQMHLGARHFDDGLRHRPQRGTGVVRREELFQRLPRLGPVPVGQAHEGVQSRFGKHILKLHHHNKFSNKYRVTHVAVVAQLD